VFEYLKQKPYVETTSADIKTEYKKELNKILIYLHSDSIKNNVSVRLSEGWYPLWKSDDVTIKEDEFGYISFEVPQINGEKIISINFVKPYYYEVGKLISLVSLVVLSIFLIFNFFGHKRFV
jgi:hypothetical protein